MKKVKAKNPLLWLIEPLVTRDGYLHKKMFGCEAIYLDSQLVLVLAASDEPWNGILIPTDRRHHGSLIEEFSELVPHAILGKWLYLSQTNPKFESISTEIVECIRRRRDLRFGIEPKPKKARKTRRRS